MEPHAPKGQKSLFDMGCTKRPRTAADGQPTELRTRLAPNLEHSKQERERSDAEAAAARPPPPPPNPVGRPRFRVPLLPPAPPAPPQCIWAVLKPVSGQERVSLSLWGSKQAATDAARGRQLVWVRLDVGGARGSKVVVVIRDSPFPVKKQWSLWEKEFAVETAARCGSGGRSGAARWMQQHFSSRFGRVGERRGG